MSEIFFATKRKIMLVETRLKNFDQIDDQKKSELVSHECGEFLPVVHDDQTMSSRIKLVQTKNDIDESITEAEEADGD